MDNLYQVIGCRQVEFVDGSLGIYRILYRIRIQVPKTNRESIVSYLGLGG